MITKMNACDESWCWDLCLHQQRNNKKTLSGVFAVFPTGGGKGGVVVTV